MKFILLVFCCVSVPAAAQTLIWEIALSIETAPNDGKSRFMNQLFPGLVEVDSSRIQGVGEEKIGFEELDPAFTLSLTFDEQTYSSFDDPAVGFPALYFSAGELEGVDFAVYLADFGYEEGTFVQLHADGLMSYSLDGVGEYQGRYLLSPHSVPEASVSMLLALFGSFTFTLRIR